MKTEPLPPDTIRLPAEWDHAGELLAPEGARAAILEGLSRAGSVPVSENTSEILRVEAGRPRWGQDASEANLAEEVGLEAAISATKGCYVGQEIVARMRTYGKMNRRLAGLRFPGGPVGARNVLSGSGEAATGAGPRHERRRLAALRRDRARIRFS